MPVNTGFSDTRILFAANLNSNFALAANVQGDAFTGPLVANNFVATTIIANTSIVVNNIDVASGLASAYNAANGAFAKANTGGSSGGSGSFTFIANTAQPGLTVNNSVNIIVPANNAVIIGANASSTTQVGVVQLSDVMGTAVTTKAATANTVFNAWNYAQSAFSKANTSGTTGVSGILQLNDTTLSTSTTLAATANSVNTAWAYAQSAFSRANTLDGIASINFVASPSLTVNSGVSLTITGNNTVVIGANSGTVSQIGVVQLNDVLGTSSTSLAATANTVFNAWNYAQSAFSRANTGGSGGGNITYIANTSQPGLTVNNGVNISLSGNNVLILGANAGTVSQVGVVQLNDTTISVSTTLAGTANSVNTAMTYAQGAFTNANNALARTGGTITGSLVVNNNVTGANIVTSGSVNSSSILVTPITSAANYILSQRDNGNVVTFANAGATTLVNVNNTLSVGFRTVLTQIGSGNVQVQAGANVTINPASGILNQIASRYSSAVLFCYAANTFILDGNLI